MASDPARSPAASGRPLLEVCRVDAAYGPYRALFEVSFEVAEGTAVALVGPNGAGKSTVARVVSGLVRPTAGSVRFAGRDVTRWPAWRIARLGLAHAPEGRSVFATLSVEENLVLTFRQAVGRRGQAEALSRAFGAFPRLAERRHQAAGTLSGGEQRMLTLARVFAVPQRLLVVDELSLGLDPVVLDEVFAALRSLRDTGTALLVIEQHVARALELAQWAVVLARGRVVHQGPAAEAGEVVAALLPAARAAPAAPGRAGDGRAGRGGDA
ncbi:MAG TPA: ABC transporter ATP-binding protein [Acidimicrobiales bacterium]|nr:ABC transporter ATP-binding protein [Acidimicrobiales bacterium]